MKRKKMRPTVSDTPAGFQGFMAQLESPIPPHMESCIEDLYEARQVGKPGIVAEMHRGASKTTTLSIGWTCFQIGHHPELTNLVIGLNDTAANEVTSEVQRIISKTDGFRKCFPYVEPHPDRVWGQRAGYFVRRSDVSSREWERTIGIQKDPSFIALGILSGQLVGKHPSGVLIVDDLVDTDTATSEAEMNRIHGQVSGIIDNALDNNPIEIWIGTPYHVDDPIQRRKATALYWNISVPLYVEHEEEVRGSVFDGDIQKYIVINWPDRISLGMVQQMRAKDKIASGGRDFPKHQLLDLTAGGSQLLQFSRYPKNLMDPTWKNIITVDPATVISGHSTRYSDHLAICVAAIKPSGGLVIHGGARRHATQHEAEVLVQNLCETYKPTLLGVESHGKGQALYEAMMQIGLPLVELKPGGRSKADRIERGLQPQVETGGITVVTESQNEFVTGLLSEAATYPSAKYDDALDAAAYLVDIAGYALPTSAIYGRRIKKKRKMHPFGYFAPKYDRVKGPQ